MMDIPLDEVIHFDAISSASTGAATDADSTPTFAVYEESTDTDIGVGGNMTKRTSLTGNYRGSFTASAANGFELGKWYNVIGTATIGGIACKGVLARFRIVAAEATAGYPVITHKVGTGSGELNSSGGKVPATVAAGDIANNAITAAAVADGAIDNATLAADVRVKLHAAQPDYVPATAAALATAQTSLDDIPTNAEFTAALAAADDAVLAAIAALNNLSQANIRTAVGLASANLDTQLDALPTNAELATALGTADDAVLAAIAALNAGVDLSEQSLADIGTLLRAIRVTISQLPLRGQRREFIQTDDHLDANGTGIDWTISNASGLADMTSWTVRLRLIVKGETAVSDWAAIAVPTGSTRSGVIDWENLGADLTQRGEGEYRLEFRDASENECTLVRGQMELLSRTLTN